MGDTALLKEMGARIYQRRKFLQYTQEELAEKLGVSTQMISNLELGKKAIRPENLLKLCAVLNISADYVLTGQTAKNPVEGISEKLLSLSSEELLLVEHLIDYMTGKK